MSLRLRVFLLTVVLFTAGLVAAGFAIPSLVRGFLVERLDERLPGVGVAAIGEVRPFPRMNVADDPLLDVAGGYAVVEAADGTVLFDGFLDPDDERLQRPDLPETAELAAASGAAVTVEGTGEGEPTDYRAAVLDEPLLADVEVPTAEGVTDLTITVALPLTEVDDALGSIVRVELAVGAVVLLLVGAGTWWVVGLGLRPLRAMEDAADSIRSSGFEGDARKRRISHPSDRTEIGRLGATLNGMLDEIDDAFDRQASSEARLRRFVADASHELRTPLTSIRGYAQLVRRAGDAGLDDPEQVRASIGRVEAESVRMSALVEDLLTLARLDEHPSLRLERVDVAELLAELAADARAADGSRPITARCEPGLRVTADRSRLAQALLNLVANASTHTPAGTPIELRAERMGAPPDDRVRLSVVDHGAGIPPEARTVVFERFARLDASRSRDAGGSGLGLAIVAAIAAAHGGTVGVQETRCGGATFTIDLPGASRTA